MLRDATAPQHERGLRRICLRRFEMLSVNKLNQYYGGSHILRDVSFELPTGKVTALLGRNGVGKTTLLRTLMGLVPAASGSISFEGRQLDNAPPYERARKGIGYVPQG